VLGDGAPRDNGRVIWRGVIKYVADFNFPSTDGDGAAAAAAAAQGGVGFPELCPEGFTVMKASTDSSVVRRCSLTPG